MRHTDRNKFAIRRIKAGQNRIVGKFLEIGTVWISRICGSDGNRLYTGWVGYIVEDPFQENITDAWLPTWAKMPHVFSENMPLIIEN